MSLKDLIWPPVGRVAALKRAHDSLSDARNRPIDPYELLKALQEQGYDIHKIPERQRARGWLKLVWVRPTIEYKDEPDPT